STTKRFFSQGEQQGISSLFYAYDHLGSVREMINSSGTLEARYDYDPYGRTSKLWGDANATFNFTGHYNHGSSSLVLSLFRAYDPSTGRWLSQDPVGVIAGPNLHIYVDGNPIRIVDPLGL